MEGVLGDLQVLFDGLVVVTGIFPDLCTRNDFFARLTTGSLESSLVASSRVVLVDLLDEVGSMLVSNSESLAEHASLLVHIDCFFGLLGVDEALLGLRVISAIKAELGLVDEDLRN